MLFAIIKYVHYNARLGSFLTWISVMLIYTYPYSVFSQRSVIYLQDGSIYKWLIRIIAQALDDEEEENQVKKVKWCIHCGQIERVIENLLLYTRNWWTINRNCLYISEYLKNVSIYYFVSKAILRDYSDLCFSEFFQYQQSTQNRNISETPFQLGYILVSVLFELSVVSIGETRCRAKCMRIFLSISFKVASNIKNISLRFYCFDSFL